MADEIIPRADAKAQGLKRYFTGEPCKNGHIAERSVSQGTCVACVLEKGRRWVALNPERARKRDRKWKADNRELRLARQRKRHTEPGPYRDAVLARRKALRKENWERVREQERAYRAADPEKFRERGRRDYYKNRESYIANSKRWREENPEKCKEYLERVGYQKNREWIANNKERYDEWYKEWRRNNKDRIYAHISKRRALKKESSGQYTAEESNAILAAQGHKCANCNADLRKVKRHIDHIIPLSKGGTNDKKNIQWLCQTCNLKKNDKDPLAFAREQGRLL
jgi:5-methylcytosine-specific restriction endonuclease McrA